MLHCGIVGLPLSGKTTLFNVITRAGAEVKAYAGGKTDPNRAMVAVPDERFDCLVELYQPKKATPAQVEFVDLAGLSRDASKGAGLGNAFLSFVADADALIHVIRCFDNPSVEHPEGNIDPIRDFSIVEMELIYRDLSVIENRLNRLSSKKRLLPEEEMEKELILRCQAFLMGERPLREMPLSEGERRMLRGFTFVTQKPEIVVLNLDETQTDDSRIPGIERLRGLKKEGILKILKIFGRFEMELADLPPGEAAELTLSLGIERTGREELISEAYRFLGLLSFFTCGSDEVRAWTLKKGQTALDAARTIHSDLARGFIRAQVIHYDDFIACGKSVAKCRESGLLRLEGKDYVVQDGDIIEIRFNV